MRTRDIERLRTQLEQKRREVVEAYRKAQAENREAAGEPLQDLGDQASESYRKEFLYSLTDAERDLLRMVDEALERIEEGTYDECQSCGDKIGDPRLKAIPWAKYCIDCQEQREAADEV